jgi:TRAP-type C4-dicarboxylate transport system permease small subunit
MPELGPSGRRTAVERFLRLYDRVVEVIGVTLLSIIVVVMGFQVFFRYVLNNSIIWAEELSSYMLVLISFLLLGAAFRRGEMMNVEFLVGRLSPRVRAAVNVPIYLAMTAFLLTLCYYCYQFALLNRSASIPALDFIVSSITGQTRTVVVSRFWLYLVLPVGLGILALHVIVAAARDALVLLGRRPSDARSPRDLLDIHKGKR